MAYIGMYGVYYAKATIQNGLVTGYTGGMKTMGKAISADFQPNSPDADNLYANNAVAESNNAGATGGTLKTVLDRLTTEAAADLFGLTVEEVSVTVGSETVTGTGLKYTGLETSAPVGVAYIRMKQEDGVRSHEAVIYRRVTYKLPGETAQTIGENGKVEWKTPELEGSVMGLEGDGDSAWCEVITFPTQAAALKYVENYFSRTAQAAG